MPELSLFPDVSLSLSARPASAPVPKLLYSRKDGAFALSISIRSLDIAVANGQIPVRKLGKRVMIPVESLLRYASMDHDTLTQHDSKDLVM
jgi:hypothetical protein